MYESTNSKQRELLATQTTAENNHKENSPLIERQQIENTPFWIIGNKETGYNLVMGKWKLTTQPHKTKNDLKKWMNKNHWNLTLTMIICATNDLHTITEEENQNLLKQEIANQTYNAKNK